MNCAALSIAAAASASVITAVADAIISELLIFVGLRQKGQQSFVGIRAVFEKTREFRADTRMRLGDLASALNDKSLRRVKRCIIGQTRRDFGELDRHDLARIGQIAPCLIKVVTGFRRHRSTPSRRSSCISPVRSR